jgi:hypothetical protein
LNDIKYFIIQIVLFCVIILIGFFSDKYISKPFSYVDILAIITMVPIFILVLNLGSKLKNRLKPIHILNKILLSISGIIIATVFTGVLTGEMTF